jgi:hypothetical protein
MFSNETTKQNFTGRWDLLVLSRVRRASRAARRCPERSASWPDRRCAPILPRAPRRHLWCLAPVALVASSLNAMPRVKVALGSRRIFVPSDDKPLRSAVRDPERFQGRVDQVEQSCTFPILTCQQIVRSGKGEEAGLDGFADYLRIRRLSQSLRGN